MTVRPQAVEAVEAPVAPPQVSFDADPARYRHWRVAIDGEVARLVLDVDERGGVAPGYDLKLNSYDLGVDIELHDAVQRLRFEHPEVGAVVITAAHDRVFSAGANIPMLAQSSHAWKVNFCKFTNETRNGIEDATAHSGQTYIAALNGTASGGGYELALACDRILLVDDGASAVSLPEVPLLGVLAGTGGLTRLVDKRGVRRDLADVVATRAEGVRGQTAVTWRLVDEAIPRGRFDEAVDRCARTAAARSARPRHARGIRLEPLRREVSDAELVYAHVRADLDRSAGVVAITVAGPSGDQPHDVAGIHALGAAWWPLALARELDDLILRLRINELHLGTWVLRTRGDLAAVRAAEQALVEHADDWLVNEVRHFLKRTLKRLDVTSRTLVCLVEPGSCFAGLLLELALAADRSFMLDGGGGAGDQPPVVVLGDTNFGAFPMGNDLTRLQTRYLGDAGQVERLRARIGTPLDAAAALELGLVTFAPDEIDWEDEVRLTLEERTSFNPDALSGLEANCRFAGPETMETKIFARLSAWQNWIFTRPNAAGPTGALQRYGTGQRATFDTTRV
ncbi:MAG TPA: 2,3-epoxybenzoyl-CoA dihydrolase [Candidatus Dormibacteraeota bacterium]